MRSPPAPRLRLATVLLLAGTAAALAPVAAHAEAKATFKDRLEQIVATFMGDPAAGVDIDMKHVLDRWREMKPKPLDDLSASDARRQPTPIEAATSLLESEGKTLDAYKIDHKDMSFAGPTGDQLKVRVYTPAAQGHDGDKARPIVVFFHGGGFVLDNVASTHASSRAIAGGGDFIVVAPDYRLAPEHKFPAAPDDALAAYKWVLANAAGLGGDPARIALAGEGAGAQLAVDTAIAARDAHLPKAKALALITPAAGIDLKTNSWMQDSTARPWNLKAVQWAFRQYLPNQDARYDPRIDIVGTGDVSDLPPTTIVTAEDDPLRSDGERLGGKLKIATVPVEMRDFPGVTHDFFGMGGRGREGGAGASLRHRGAEERLRDAERRRPGAAGDGGGALSRGAQPHRRPADVDRAERARRGHDDAEQAAGRGLGATALCGSLSPSPGRSPAG